MDPILVGRVIFQREPGPTVVLPSTQPLALNLSAAGLCYNYVINTDLPKIVAFIISSVAFIVSLISVPPVQVNSRH